MKWLKKILGLDKQEEKLTEMAMVNGEFEQSEKEFIQYVKGLVN